MKLIYLDESGNTGCKLDDPHQPIFILAALIVSEEQWQEVEKRLLNLINTYFPDRPDDFEIHANEIINPRKSYLRGLKIAHRLEFYKDALGIIDSEKLTVIYRSIDKKQYKSWQREILGQISVNPHIPTYSLIAYDINEYLLSEKSLGILISDENRQIMYEAEKAQRHLRLTESPLRLSQILEKGFFIDSKKSLLLQLADLCAYCFKIKGMSEAGFPIKNIHKAILDMTPEQSFRKQGAPEGFLDWFETENKKSG